jgi:L-alanine-DL-glutamate epimerase-like enolase superfamily enzyme
LRIDRLEIVPYALPFREPYVTARGRLDRRELLLVRIAAGGHEGLGEAAPLSLRGGPGLGDIARDLERCRPLLEGGEVAPKDPYLLVRRCAARGISPQALAAVELGLLDLCGRLSGRPVWSLLGAERASRVACNATLVAAEPETVAARAARWAEQGFTSFKLKCGVNGDVEQVRAVRDALGPQARIRVDANGAWTPEQAVARLHELEPLEIELAEQPAATLEGMAAVRSRVSVPVVADESVADAEDARAAASVGACDAATVKLAKVGGIAAARELAAILSVYLSSALDGPVGIAAAAHLAQVLPATGFAANLAHGLATAGLFDGTIASTECEVTDAALVPSEAPGLGVEIDEQALARHRL